MLLTAMLLTGLTVSYMFQYELCANHQQIAGHLLTGTQPPPPCLYPLSPFPPYPSPVLKQHSGVAILKTAHTFWGLALRLAPTDRYLRILLHLPAESSSRIVNRVEDSAYG